MAEQRDEPFARMAHALRTPLNVILNWVQLLRMEELDESTRNLAIEMIERNVKELAALLAQFENLSLTHDNGLPAAPVSAGGSAPQPPRVEPSPPAIKQAGASRPDLPLQGLKILVVDDEADSRALLRIMLSQAGAEVTAVESVKEALAQFQRSVPDILISDIAMQGEDGYSLIRSVRRLGAEAGGTIPALALTAYATSDDHNRTQQAGFDAYLSKPVEPSDLEQVVVKLKSQIPSAKSGV
jgi:CheY-like chemotaxis protein